MSTLTIMSNDSTFPLFIHFPLFAWVCVCVCVHKQFVQWTFWALRCFDKRCQLQNVLEDCAECTDFCGCHLPLGPNSIFKSYSFLLPKQTKLCITNVCRLRVFPKMICQLAKISQRCRKLLGNLG